MFFNEDGSPKFSLFGAAVAIVTVIALLFFTQSIGLAFERFFRAGIFMIAGPVLGFLLARRAIKTYNKTQEWKSSSIILPLLLWFIGIFGPLVAIKSDKAQGIPDEALYFSNGKIINLVEYFDKVDSLSQKDSLYIVSYGEEPGINLNNGYMKNAPDSLKSKAPRANEYWTRPILKEKKKLGGKY